MAKVKGPLLSMRASGTIAKTNVFASWRGVPYVRIHVIPANPQTAGQDLTRNTFRWLNDLYRRLGVYGVSPWIKYATGRPFAARNGFIKQNLPVLRTEVTLANLIASPGALGGPALDSFTPNTGAPSGKIDFDFTIGPLPAGWTLLYVAGIAVNEQNPQDLGPIEYGEGFYTGANPQTFTISGLTPATDFACGGWAKYARPDGVSAYSVSETALVTSSA